jgi:hypothetical protein
MHVQKVSERHSNGNVQEVNLPKNNPAKED